MPSYFRGLSWYLTVFAAFTTVFFSISSSSILILLSGASSVSCAFWRVFISSTILWLIILLKGKVGHVFANRRTLLLSTISGCALGVHFLLWMESLFWVPVSVSTSVVVTYPLFALIADRFLLKEKIRSLQVIGLIGGFIGVLLFTHPKVLGGYSVYGVLLSLGGAIAGAVYFTVGRIVRKNIGLLEYVVPTYTTASLLLLAYSFLIGENILQHSFNTYIYFILLALIPMIGGHTVMNYLLKYLKTSIVTSIALGEPVGASILAYYILGQEVDLLKASAMALVLFSLFLVITQGIKEKQCK